MKRKNVTYLMEKNVLFHILFSWPLIFLDGIYLFLFSVFHCWPLKIIKNCFCTYIRVSNVLYFLENESSSAIRKSARVFLCFSLFWVLFGRIFYWFEIHTKFSIQSSRTNFFLENLLNFSATSASGFCYSTKICIELGNKG